MTKDKLLHILEMCAKSQDEEEAHIKADKALLAYIEDKEITKAFNKINKWYA